MYAIAMKTLCKVVNICHAFSRNAIPRKLWQWGLNLT